jgi:hypothetical protein
MVIQQWDEILRMIATICLTLRSAVHHRRSEARPSFASRVKTLYIGSFGGMGKKARLSIRFAAESEAARLGGLG